MISQKALDREYILERLNLLTDDRVVYKVSEWAENKRYIPSELSPIPGHYDNANNMPMVEIISS